MKEVCIILGLALMYRARGGWIPLGSTQAARVLLWSLPVGLAGFWLHDWKVGALSAVGAFLGLMLPHGIWYHVRDLKDFLCMGGIGVLRVLGIVLPYALPLEIGAPLVLLGGLHGCMYWLGWRIQGGTELGEVLTGALIGLILVLTQI